MHQEDQDHEAEPVGADEPAATSGVTSDVTCPFCSSREVELISLFGGQLSTDQYYCRACRTYFERFTRDDGEPDSRIE